MANSRAQNKAPQTGAVNPFSRLDPDALLTAMQANTNAIDIAMQLNTEMAGFLNHRLSEDFSLPSKIAAGQNTEQMTQVYTDFISNASLEYMAEFEKITSMLSQASSRS